MTDFSHGYPGLIFCVYALLVRVTAFIMRAIIAASDSAAENKSLAIADEVLSGVGFFGLLYSAYTLVLDRYVTLAYIFLDLTWSFAGNFFYNSLVKKGSSAD